MDAKYQAKERLAAPLMVLTIEYDSTKLTPKLASCFLSTLNHLLNLLIILLLLLLFLVVDRSFEFEFESLLM